jgi:spermidine synthase
MTAWNHPRLLGTRDTPYGRVTVTDRLGQVAVFESDALAFESEGTAAEEFVHLAAVQRVAPRRVLILGGGAQGLVPEVLKHRPGAVEDLELDARALALAVGHQPEALRRALADGRVRVRITDPRRDIESHRHRDASGVAAVDLILVGMPEPESGRANRYYTREFFAACARRLAPEGVLALRLKSAENLWTPVLARRAAGIRQALLESFPHVVVLPGATNVLLASRVPLERDPEVLGERLRARGIEARLVTPAYVRYLYTNDRFSEVERLLERTRARANSDAQPSCYQATMLLWLARFFPRLGRVDLPEPEVSSVTGSPWIWAGAVAIAGLLLWSRRRGALRRALLAGLAGFAGMLLEAVLLLRYQAGSGVLYQNLGVLLTMFMAGLALGARGTEILRGLGALGLAALLILGLAGACLPGAAVGGFGVAALLLLACGASVGAAFAFSVLQGNPDAKAAVGPVYAADLAGGCAGSLIAGLVTIPMLGLSATSGLAAVVAVAALLLV